MLLENLNDDALLHILEHIAREDENGAFIIISVCSRWAALAFDTPSLWRYVTLADYIEDWEARLSISTTLAQRKTLIVKAVFPVSASSFSALLQHQILHLKVHVSSADQFDYADALSFIADQLRFCRQGIIQHISWHEGNAISLPKYLSEALHLFVGQNLSDALKKTVDQYPSVLCSHFTVGAELTPVLPGHKLMGYLATMTHLVSLKISEMYLTWAEAEHSQSWTLPLLERLEYTFMSSESVDTPRLRLNAPKLSELYITTAYSSLPPIFSNFTGFKEINVLSLIFPELSLLPASMDTLCTGVTHINTVTLDMLRVYDVVPSGFLSFSEIVSRLLRSISVQKWKMVVGYPILRFLPLFKASIEEIHVTYSAEDGKTYPSARVASDEEFSLAATGFLTTYETLVISSDLYSTGDLLRELPPAKKLIFPLSGTGFILNGNDLPPQFIATVQTLDIANRCRPLVNYRLKPPVVDRVFTALTRLSASLEVVEMLFYQYSPPVLEELVLVSPFLELQMDKDTRLGSIIQMFLQRGSGPELARLHTLSIDWWPRWDEIEALIHEWSLFPTMDSRYFTLKLPHRPHPRVLEALVDVLSGFNPRNPLPVTPAEGFQWKPENCWPCLRSGFTCACETYPDLVAFGAVELFTVTKDAFVGEYEKY